MLCQQPPGSDLEQSQNAGSRHLDGPSDRPLLPGTPRLAVPGHVPTTWAREPPRQASAKGKPGFVSARRVADRQDLLYAGCWTACQAACCTAATNGGSNTAMVIADACHVAGEHPLELLKPPSGSAVSISTRKTCCLTLRSMMAHMDLTSSC